MKDILFICRSNVSRSQFAEAFYNKFIRKGGAISAGISPTEHKHPSQKGIEIMNEEGIDISKQKVKALTKEMTSKVKKIISFVEKEQLPDYVSNFKNIEFWKVDDPHFFDMNGRRKIRDIIKNKILSLSKRC